MKSTALLTAVVLSFGAFMFASAKAADEAKPDSSAAAADKKPDEKAPASQPTTQAAIVNKKCPVGGEDVDPKGKTVTYKGKTIGFCCDECIADFNKDPEKYAKALGIK